MERTIAKSSDRVPRTAVSVTVLDGAADAWMRLQRGWGHPADAPVDATRQRPNPDSSTAITISVGALGQDEQSLTKRAVNECRREVLEYRVRCGEPCEAHMERTIAQSTDRAPKTAVRVTTLDGAADAWMRLQRGWGHPADIPVDVTQQRPNPDELVTPHD